MLLFFQILFTTIIGALTIIYLNQLRRYKAVKPLTGPPLIPIIGNVFEFSRTPEGIYSDFLRLTSQCGKIFQVWIGPFAQYVIVSNPKIAEKIMNSSKHIDKMDIYEYFVPWLGYGLLTSTGEKWRKRRKMLTPAFHFTILEQAIESFNNASNVMIEKLKKHIDGEPFDIYPNVALCSLDIICEAAMGIKVNAQINSKSDYVCAVRNACNIVFGRLFTILSQSDFYFYNFSKMGKLYTDSVKILHNTTNKVIKERRNLLLQETDSKNESNAINETGKRRPMAFLDTLLKSTIDGRPLTDADIREEVDTFMFEGHDTVSSGISFTLYLLANHPEIQEKCFNEIREVVGDDLSKMPTIAEMNSMKYLEAVIKESMRLYPPVPVIGRQLTEDLYLDEGCKLPNRTSVFIWIHWMQRLEEIFPDPNSFKPERFLDSRNDGDKNIFSYIPFSAGPRNCIGQKFAMYEMKSTISKILRNYELLSAGPDYKLELVVAIIFKSTNGIPVKIVSRRYS